MQIDLYVQHLVRHNAEGALLQSDQPVSFRFGGAERQSNKKLTHEKLQHLVHEAAPEDTLSELMIRGRATFNHQSDAGTWMEVEVTQLGPEDLIVKITPIARPNPLHQQSQRSIERPSSLDGPATQRESRPDRESGAEERESGALPRPESRGDAPTLNTNTSAPGLPAVLGSIGLVPGPKTDRGSRPGEPEAHRYLRAMIAHGASDLHLSPECPPMARIDGAIRPLEPGAGALSPEKLKQLIMEITPTANREEFEAQNDTDFAYAIEGLARFRANVFRDRKGVGAVFRQIPFELLSVDQIGLPKKVLDLCWLTKGLVLVTGPTGSGKSTTLSTLIDFINEHREDHVVTIEDPIEFVHKNKRCLINQREIGTHTRSFKSALRAALREDPDIVLVGEMRDLETIAIAIETAETGHLVFGTLHTTSAPSTVDRIIDQFPADQQEQIRVMLSESLRGVIAQVLCKKIGGGRIAAYEILIANNAIANLIREGKTFQLKSAMQTGRAQGMQTLNDHLMDHVRNGLVSPEEAYMKCNDKLSFKQQLQSAGYALP